MGLPVPEHRPGDCYVWGSCEPRSNGSATVSPVCSSPVNCNPSLVSESSHLDVCEVWLYHAVSHLTFSSVNRHSAAGLHRSA